MSLLKYPAKNMLSLCLDVPIVVGRILRSSYFRLNKSVVKFYGFMIVSCLVLSGCVGVVMEGAHISKDKVIRDRHMQAALAGDAEAQYKVGKSFCCAPRHDIEAVYNNQKATEFLCAAARQGHPQAAYELGKIHSGGTIDGARLIRRIGTVVRGDGQHHDVLAYYWLIQAKLSDHEDAQGEIDDLAEDFQTDDWIALDSYTNPQTTPCTIKESYE